MATVEAIPAGTWQRDPSHYPVALTPLYIELRFPAGGWTVMKAAGHAFSLPLPSRSAIAVDGWEYFGTLDDADTSPARVAAFEENVRNRLEATVLQRWHTERRPAELAWLQRLQAVDRAALTNAELLEHSHELSDCQYQAHTTHFTDGHAGSVYAGRLALFCQAELGVTPPEVLQLLAGFSTATREPAAKLEAVAARIIGDPDLRAALHAPDAASDPRLTGLLAPWVEAYGYRSTAFEFNVPTLVEQPEEQVRLLREAVARIESDPVGIDARVRSARQAAIAALRERLPDEAKRMLFDGLLAEAQAAYQVRDDDESFSRWATGLQRLALLEVGKRLAAQDRLDDPEKIWYLRLAEVEEFLTSGSAGDLCPRVAERQAEHHRQQATVPPERLGLPAMPPKLPRLSDAAMAWLRAAAWSRDFVFTPADSGAEPPAAGALHGAAAARGVYRGPARIVLSEEEFDRVQPGDVLVCPVTTPSWNVLFGSVGALVTNEGGILSHPAIIAREFGIPAVVGTRTATDSFPDGAIVEVDGDAGAVRW
ncbi:MAG TPA: PEP-utilizing enzyme [Dehalococcoidia bacterium]|nr:PEP-utilizing enzyme [Dehalococcoidia bacterium]